MNMSPEEAQASLAVIQQTRAKVNKSIGVAGYFLIIWGLVWFVGCLGNQYLSGSYLGLVWGIGSTIGWILSAMLGIYLGKRTRSHVGPRMAFFFLALLGFATLWFLSCSQPASNKMLCLY